MPTIHHGDCIEMEPDYLPLIQHRIDRQAGTLTA